MAVSWSLMRCSKVLVFLIAVGQVCAAQEPKCCVHGGPDEYKYEVKINTGTEKCDCETWSNATEFVLASCKEKDHRLVLNNTSTCLVTLKFIAKVIYRRSCDKPYEVTCDENCPQDEPPVNHSLRDSPGHIVGYIILAVVLVVPVAAIAAYLWKRINGPKTSENPAALL